MLQAVHAGDAKRYFHGIVNWSVQRNTKNREIPNIPPPDFRNRLIRPQNVKNIKISTLPTLNVQNLYMKKTDYSLSLTKITLKIIYTPL